MSLKLIADSGSTKTDWALVDETGQVVGSCKSQGLNPYHLDESEILKILEQVRLDLQPSQTSSNDSLQTIFFYGSGVTEAMKPKMQNLLSQVFTDAECHAESDMLGAARAVLGHQKGIAFILGTGSNNCYYDGEKIVTSIPPLGYILGDECSGTAIGKEFLRCIFRDPEALPLQKKYLEDSGLDYATIINKVYRQPLANRFLASIAHYVGDQLKHYQELSKKYVDEDAPVFSLPSMPEKLLSLYKAYQTLDSRLEDMFDQYLLFTFEHYDKVLKTLGVDSQHLLPVGFVGSIASNFTSYLVLPNMNYRLAKVMGSPIEGLITYHS